MARRTKVLIAAGLFVVSFSIKSLYAVDLAPVMYTTLQPGIGMSRDYDMRATSMLEGQGILLPDQRDPADTRLLVHPPGYYIFLAATYGLAGRSYFSVQLVQNLANSLSVVLAFLIAGELVSWRTAAVAGLLAALSHHMGYYSNLILADSLCALPILGAIYLVVRGRTSSRARLRRYVTAGLLVGVSVWLRANALMLGIFLAVFLAVIGSRRRSLLVSAAALAAASLVVVAPITIRNYVVYHEFVPVQIGAGLNLWEGLGDASSGLVGATRDDEVAQQEAESYGDPRYAASWVTPDGIRRDRDRTRNSLSIISKRPLWFAGAMFWRMGQMVRYSIEAPLVFRSGDTGLAELAARADFVDRRLKRHKIGASEEDSEEAAPSSAALGVGRGISWMRPPVRAAQRLAKETVLLFLLLGGILLAVVSWRRALFIMAVPLYYFLFQSPLHTHFRYTLPMHYFLFIFAAICWVLVFELLRRGGSGFLARLKLIWRRQSLG